MNKIHLTVAALAVVVSASCGTNGSGVISVAETVVEPRTTTQPEGEMLRDYAALSGREQDVAVLDQLLKVDTGCSTLEHYWGLYALGARHNAEGAVSVGMYISYLAEGRGCSLAEWPEMVGVVDPTTTTEVRVTTTTDVVALDWSQFAPGLKEKIDGMILCEDLFNLGMTATEDIERGQALADYIFQRYAEVGC